MSLREARVQAAIRTLEGDGVRQLLGKNGPLTTAGNVFGEVITESKYDSIVQEVE